MPLTDAECLEYAQRQIARQLTEEDIENCKGFDSDDLRRICAHLPLQTQPFVYATPLGLVVFRNAAHVKQQAALDVAAGLKQLIADIETARPEGLFPRLNPEPALDKGLMSKGHRVSASAWALSGPLVDDLWRKEAVGILRGVIDAVESQRFDDGLEAIGKIVGGRDGKSDILEAVHDQN
jgi:hypothetical protein